jgi:predicted DNA-binding transcriptional regulator YafY
VRDGRAVTFSYRTSGTTAPAQRHVEPGASCRGAAAGTSSATTPTATHRGFRMSRIVGTAKPVGPAGAVVPPAGTDLRTMVGRMAVDEPRTTARVSLRPGAGWELRREATATAEDLAREGWTVVDVGFADPERFADRVTGYGADAVVLAPDEARDAVVRRLRGLAS